MPQEDALHARRAEGAARGSPCSESFRSRRRRSTSPRRSRLRSGRSCRSTTRATCGLLIRSKPNWSRSTKSSSARTQPCADRRFPLGKRTPCPERPRRRPRPAAGRAGGVRLHGLARQPDLARAVPCAGVSALARQRRRDRARPRDRDLGGGRVPRQPRDPAGQADGRRPLDRPLPLFAQPDVPRHAPRRLRPRLALDSLWQFAALAALYVVLRWGVVAREEAYLTRNSATPTRLPARVRRWL